MVDGALLHDGHVAAGSGRASAGTMERRKREFFFLLPHPIHYFRPSFFRSTIGSRNRLRLSSSLPTTVRAFNFYRGNGFRYFLPSSTRAELRLPMLSIFFLFANGASCREETSRHDTDERMIAITVGHGRRGLPPGSLLPPKPRQSTTRERSRPPAAESKPASTTKKKRTEGCDSSRQNVKIGKKA